MFVNSWCKKRASKAFIEMLCEGILEFFNDESRLCFDEFLDLEGISDQAFENWRKRHSNLQDIYKLTIRKLATRREKGMLTRRISEKSAMHNQHQYSEKWDQANKYWAELKRVEKENERVPSYTIVVPDLLPGADKSAKAMSEPEQPLIGNTKDKDETKRIDD